MNQKSSSNCIPGETFSASIMFIGIVFAICGHGIAGTILVGIGGICFAIAIFADFFRIRAVHNKSLREWDNAINKTEPETESPPSFEEQWAEDTREMRQRGLANMDKVNETGADNDH